MLAERSAERPRPRVTRIGGGVRQIFKARREATGEVGAIIVAKLFNILVNS